MVTKNETVVLTGATGYVGQLILSELSQKFKEVRCLTRSPEKLTGLPENCQVLKVDLLQEHQIDEALEGASVAFYLVHSLNDSDDFENLESVSAMNFAQAAARNKLKRLVYLGALARASTDSSPHMRSRHIVGDILRESGVPTFELRASVIIGAGSMPFESIRALVERLPMMIIPRWVRQPLQPIAASDLKIHLLRAAEIRTDTSQVIEIGGSDVISFLDLMKIYAKARGLRRLMINVPVISPSLSSHWLRIFTPAHYQVGRRIVDSSMHDSIVTQEPVLEFAIPALSVSGAVDKALKDERESLDFMENMDDSTSTKMAVKRSTIGTRFVEQRIVSMRSDVATASRALGRTGGQYGWHWATWLWKLRALIDRCVGGVGYREAVRSSTLREGDVLNFWSVRRSESTRLTLEADMRLPGEAILDLRITDLKNGEADEVNIVHTVSFNPKGFLGFVYWYTLFPIHTLVFSKMIKSMVAKIEAEYVPEDRF